MDIIQRLKNLWKLSEYRLYQTEKEQVLVKDIPTVEKKLAQIIVDKPDLFQNDSTD